MDCRNSLFPRSPTLTTGEGLSISERKMLFGFISNESVPAIEERDRLPTRVYCVVLCLEKSECRQY